MRKSYCPLCGGEIIGDKNLCSACQSLFNDAVLSYEGYEGEGWVDLILTTTDGQKYRFSFNLADARIERIKDNQNNGEKTTDDYFSIIEDAILDYLLKHKRMPHHLWALGLSVFDLALHINNALKAYIKKVE